MRYLALYLTLAACAGDPAQTLADAAPDTTDAAADVRDDAPVEAAVDAAPDASAPDAPVDVAVADAPADVPAVDVGADVGADAGADAAPADRPDAADVATDAPDPLEGPAAALSIAFDDGRGSPTPSVRSQTCTVTTRAGAVVSLDFSVDYVTSSGALFSVSGFVRPDARSALVVGTVSTLDPLTMIRGPYFAGEAQRYNAQVSAVVSGRPVVVTIRGCAVM